MSTDRLSPLVLPVAFVDILFTNVYATATIFGGGVSHFLRCAAPTRPLGFDLSKVAGALRRRAGGPVSYLRLKIEAILAIVSRCEKVRCIVGRRSSVTSGAFYYSLVHLNDNSGPIAFVLGHKVYVPDHRYGFTRRVGIFGSDVLIIERGIVHPNDPISLELSHVH